MSTAWWLITSAAAFGYLVTALPLLRPLGAKHVAMISHAPLAALTVQALVLWAAGTAVLGTIASLAAGAAVMAVVMKFQWKGQKQS